MGMTRLLAGALTAANLALSGALLALAPAVAIADTAPAVVLEASVAERRAVRGRGLADVFEPAELDVLRRFERTRLAVPPAAVPAADATAADWARTLENPDLPVPLDREVLAFVDYLKGDPEGRVAAVALLGRLDRWRRPVGEALARGGAPRWLAYAALARSGFEPAAVAADGAAGLWMLSAERAQALGLTVSYWKDGRRDPQRATEAVARFVGERSGTPPAEALLSLFRGSRAAAGAGDGTLPPSVLPPEAPVQSAAVDRAERLFLARTFALALIGENRQALGFDRAVEGPRFDPVELPAGITLATVARAAGSSIEVLRGLNPALLRDRVPPQRGNDASNDTLWLPAGTAASCREALASMTGPADRAGGHLLRMGESLDDVARRYGLSARELRRFNGVRDSTELRGGTTLLIPRRSEGQLDLTAAGEDVGEEEFVLAGVPNQEFSYPERERVFYRTCEGDTLDELASAFDLEPAEIKSWNLLDDGARLQSRMVLQLHVRPEVLARERERVLLVDPQKLKVAVLGSEDFHALEAKRRGKNRVFVTARAGDTLVKIARRLGLEPGDLARVNRQAWWTELPEGQRIVAYAAAPGARELAAGRARPPSRPLARPPAARKPAKTK
jgi:membrane-bound lytic murein transglycosylase D